jgi:hypothetical protein
LKSRLKRVEAMFSHRIRLAVIRDKMEEGRILVILGMNRLREVVFLVL